MNHQMARYTHRVRPSDPWMCRRMAACLRRSTSFLTDSVCSRLTDRTPVRCIVSAWVWRCHLGTRASAGLEKTMTKRASAVEVRSRHRQRPPSFQSSNFCSHPDACSYNEAVICSPYRSVTVASTCPSKSGSPNVIVIHHKANIRSRRGGDLVPRQPDRFPPDGIQI